MSTEQKTTENSGLQTVISVAGIIFCIIFGVMLLCNLTIIIKGTANPDAPPSILGVTPLVVQSGSMSGDAPDHIEVGDLIFVNRVDANTLKKDDIIAFTENKIVVTHRIVDVKKGEDGSPVFTTKGDANNIVDAEPVTAENIIGVYKGRVPMLGDFAMFLQQPLGMIIFIGVPLFSFIIYDIIRRQKYARRKNESMVEMEAELERLRILAGEKDGQESSED